ncbi:MAG: hypothetical protein ACK56F_01895, partial [bacterium]
MRPQPLRRLELRQGLLSRNDAQAQRNRPPTQRQAHKRVQLTRNHLGPSRRTRRTRRIQVTPYPQPDQQH